MEKVVALRTKPYEHALAVGGEGFFGDRVFDVGHGGSRFCCRATTTTTTTTTMKCLGACGGSEAKRVGEARRWGAGVGLGVLLASAGQGRRVEAVFLGEDAGAEGWLRRRRAGWGRRPGRRMGPSSMISVTRWTVQPWSSTPCGDGADVGVEAREGGAEARVDVEHAPGRQRGRTRKGEEAHVAGEADGFRRRPRRGLRRGGSWAARSRLKGRWSMARAGMPAAWAVARPGGVRVVGEDEGDFGGVGGGGGGAEEGLHVGAAAR
jgi:hypothetical protein